MNEKTFHRRGWLCAAIAPIACLLFILCRNAGFLNSGASQTSVLLASILIVEMLVGTAAPFWWLLTAYRRKQLQRPPWYLVTANTVALILAVICFF